MSNKCFMIKTLSLRVIGVYLFLFEGFAEAASGKDHECLMKLPHNGVQLLLGCSQGKQPPLSPRNEAWHGT